MGLSAAYIVLLGMPHTTTRIDGSKGGSDRNIL